jgi:quercetin dioxygenase-like cupin family protein
MDVVDLAGRRGANGPGFGLQSEDLNATLLEWSAGRGVAEHRNDECDVLVVVLDGDATLVVDGVAHALARHHLVLVPKGSVRGLTAGPDGVRYLSIHRRRAPLMPTFRVPG